MVLVLLKMIIQKTTMRMLMLATEALRLILPSAAPLPSVPTHLLLAPSRTCPNSYKGPSGFVSARVKSLAFCASGLSSWCSGTILAETMLARRRIMLLFRVFDGEKDIERKGNNGLYVVKARWAEGQVAVCS